MKFDTTKAGQGTILTFEGQPVRLALAARMSRSRRPAVKAVFTIEDGDKLRPLGKAAPEFRLELN